MNKNTSKVILGIALFKMSLLAVASFIVVALTNV